jgi:hypothetical protein
MSTWLKTLEKMGLIQLEDGDVSPSQQKKKETDTEEGLEELEIDIEELQKELEGFEKPQIKSRSTPSSKEEGASLGSPPTPNTSDHDIQPRALSKIYDESAITPSPYPIERMIKLLDGLKAMPINMRIQAIKAMDLADDNWTIEDSILDGQRKKSAIEQEKERIKENLHQRITEIQEKKKQQDKELAQISSEIRQQISDLEQLLSEETIQVSSQKSTFEAQEKADRLAHKKTEATLQNHLDSINEVLNSLKKQ